jgi:hypothetical protein
MRQRELAIRNGTAIRVQPQALADIQARLRELTEQEQLDTVTALAAIKREMDSFRRELARLEALDEYDAMGSYGPDHISDADGELIGSLTELERMSSYVRDRRYRAETDAERLRPEQEPIVIVPKSYRPQLIEFPGKSANRDGVLGEDATRPQEPSPSKGGEEGVTSDTESSGSTNFDSFRIVDGKPEIRLKDYKPQLIEFPGKSKRMTESEVPSPSAGAGQSPTSDEPPSGLSGSSPSPDSTIQSSTTSNLQPSLLDQVQYRELLVLQAATAGTSPTDAEMLRERASQWESLSRDLEGMEKRVREDSDQGVQDARIAQILAIPEVLGGAVDGTMGTIASVGGGSPVAAVAVSYGLARGVVGFDQALDRGEKAEAAVGMAQTLLDSTSNPTAKLKFGPWLNITAATLGSDSGNVVKDVVKVSAETLRMAETVRNQARFGVGASVLEGAAQVVDGVRHFFDSMDTALEIEQRGTRVREQIATQAAQAVVRAAATRSLGDAVDASRNGRLQERIRNFESLFPEIAGTVTSDERDWLARTGASLASQIRREVSLAHPFDTTSSPNRPTANVPPLVKQAMPRAPLSVRHGGSGAVRSNGDE